MKYLTGPVVGINFHDEETGYSILRVKKGDGTFWSVKGYFYDAPNSLGRFIKTIGEEVESKEFKADVIYPASLEKVSPYIHDLFDGKNYPSLSKFTMKSLIDAHGEAWRDVLLSQKNPFEKTSLKDQAKASAERSWKAAAIRLRPYAILRNLGFTHIQAMNTVDSLGVKADYKFFKRPYILKIVSGVSFDLADKIAKGIGVNPGSSQRKQQLLINVLERLESQGNTYIDPKRVAFAMSRYIEIPPEEIEQTIRTKGIMDYRMYQLPEIGKFAAKASTVSVSKQIADHICRITFTSDTKGFRFPPQNAPFELDSLQVKAIRNSCLSGLSIITGGPGTGKTTIIKEVVEAIRFNDRDHKISYCALSGKAARRLAESTCEPSVTINSLLGMKPGERPKFNEQNQLDVDTLIIDELSMVDEPLFLDLLRAIPSHCRLVLVGDVDQLPSIGYGAVLKDLIDSNALPITRLLKSNRFNDKSAIGIAARSFNEGKVPNINDINGDDFKWTPSKDISNISNQIISEVRQLIDSGESSSSIQVLTPQVGSVAGTERLNRLLKPLMNPNPTGPSINIFGTTLNIGDRVMQSGNNDYDLNIFNGDVGVITDIDLSYRKGNEKTVTIDFNDERGQVTVPLSKMGSIKHSWAMTIHKSQGSEYDSVVMPVCSEHQNMLDKQLIYTAVTRAKRKVRMVGDIGVLSRSLKQSPRKIRNTLLSMAIRKAVSGRIQSRQPDNRLPQNQAMIA